jgi:hypothetical protein
MQTWCTQAVNTVYVNTFDGTNDKIKQSVFVDGSCYTLADDSTSSGMLKKHAHTHTHTHTFQDVDSMTPCPVAYPVLSMVDNWQLFTARAF